MEQSAHGGADAGLADVETHSIDFVPLSERHGRVRDQFTFWFAATMNVVNCVIGGVVIFLGLSFFWACVAIVLGSLVGVVLVGFHALQGPRLGVPQMVQSRGQFGFYGAVIIFVAAIVLDFGFLAAQLVIQGEAMNLLITSVSIPVWIAIFTLPTIGLAIYGYNWIHTWQRIFTGILGVTFAVILIQALTYGGLPKASAGFHVPALAAFMGGMALFVMDVVSWAPYVSDYSRYLPPTVPARRTFWAVTLGIAIPTIFSGILGAYVTGLLPNDLTVAALQQVSGNWALIVISIGLIGANALTAYTGMLALASVVSCVKDIRNSLSMRVIGIVLLSLASLIAGIVGYKSFVSNLSNFLNVLLFVFIPWSAINLIDFYLVKHGNYDVPSFFTPRGKYGGWLWRGLIPYFLAVAIEVPFIDQTLYTGPLVQSLGGVDISWIVGGVSAVVLYVIAVKLPVGKKPLAQNEAPESGREGLASSTGEELTDRRLV
jgi:NCS1 family nucleobase:cation symporter-1